MAGGAGSAIGRGGMLTKVLAAKRAARSGAHTVIAWGREPDVLLRLAGGEAIGTLLRAETPQARGAQAVDGRPPAAARRGCMLDAGAAKALRIDGKSLLPIGVIAVEGEFERGEVVGCIAPDGSEIARGLVNYGGSRSAPHPAQAVERDRSRSSATSTSPS